MLDLNIGVMLIIAGIFLVTMVLLKMWLFEPLVNFMDERDAKLKEELAMISQNTEESEKLQEEIATILQLARDDARRIIEGARKAALEEALKLKTLKQKEIDEAKESLKIQVQREKERILSELKKSENEIKTLVDNKIRKVA